MGKLTPKQKRFCDEYLISLNATQAAIKAGYREKYVHTNTTKILNNTNVQEYIQKRMDDKDKDLIASQDEVLKYLTNVLRGVEKDEVMQTNPMGEAEPVQVRRQAHQLKAAELLAKRYGILTDKVELTNRINIDDKVKEIAEYIESMQ